MWRAIVSLLSLSRALLDQQIHDRLELQRSCRIKRRTAVGVDGIHVNAQLDRKLHALQDQRGALGPIGLSPGASAADANRSLRAVVPAASIVEVIACTRCVDEERIGAGFRGDASRPASERAATRKGPRRGAETKLKSIDDRR